MKSQLPRETVWAKIDLNNRDRRNFTPVLARNFSGGEPVVGGLVEVYEPEEDLIGSAIVEEISDVVPLVYLRVDWHSIREREFLLMPWGDSVISFDARPTSVNQYELVAV